MPLKDKEYALIVAAGKGKRMQSTHPKQFTELHGKPILIHTIEAFYHYSDSIHIVIVLAKEHLDNWDTLCKQYRIGPSIKIVPGGKTRFQSVKNGLKNIQDHGLVAIHDGVRPLISPKTIATSFKLAEQHGAAVASIPLKDSIRIVDHTKTKAVDRSQYRLIQTPQTFNIPQIKKAYDMKENSNITDDAGVFEQAGYAVHLFEGDYNNIKITTQNDLAIANALMQYRNRK